MRVANVSRYIVYPPGGALHPGDPAVDCPDEDVASLVKLGLLRVVGEEPDEDSEPVAKLRDAKTMKRWLNGKPDADELAEALAIETRPKMREAIEFAILELKEPA